MSARGRTASAAPLAARAAEAALAWGALGAGRAPADVMPLASGEDGGAPRARAFLLVGAGADGTNVVAKRSPAPECAHETFVYERVLAALPVPALRVHGSLPVADDPSLRWLFLEDAGGRPPDRRDVGLKARWLATLHAASASSPLIADLPDRGAAFERARVTATIAALDARRSEPGCAPQARAVLDRALDALGRVEGAWSAIEAACAASPCVLVHGDLARRNTRVRGDGAAARLIAFDWETSGRGPAVIDLAELAAPGAGDDVAGAYADAVRDVWRGVSRSDVLAAARAAEVLRWCAALHWDAAASPGDAPLRAPATYAHGLRRALAAWGPAP